MKLALERVLVTTILALTVFAAAWAVPKELAAQAKTPGRPLARRILADNDIEDIARLEQLEDQRQLDTVELARILASPHPEVRRRAAITIGRIADKRGISVLRARPLDSDTAVAAAVVFAVGQLRDSMTVSWFDSLLIDSHTPPTAATEAAVALGKIKTAGARAVLARYLTRAAATPGSNPTIAEALLSIGRSTARGDLSSIIRWTQSPSEELRWRAVWALFRPRDPAAVSTLMSMSKDSSALVRSWAVRGLGKAQADSASAAVNAEARVLALTRDGDRRVRTEAIRTLATYADSAAIAALRRALGSSDAWISVSAAEGLGRLRSAATIRDLVNAGTPKHGCWLRVVAMQSLSAFAPHEALSVAAELSVDSAASCRSAGLQLVMRDSTRPLVQRRADIASPDPVVRLAALRAMPPWADTSDLSPLLDAYEKSQDDPSPAVASAAASVIAAIQRRYGVGTSVFFDRFTAPSNANLRRDVERAFRPVTRQVWPSRPAPAPRTLADYRAIVERWVVPDYDGRPRPVARWETTRGAIVLELYSGDAPLAVDDFVKSVESGRVVGTEFSRVVPDFVDQQAPIVGGSVLRDEVNRHRLTRGNLAWATAGLDTGTPGYTLDHTPQPHNEGDFTSVGRVTRGMDVVDRLEVGDRVTAARMLTGGSP
jgi:cyclophilin family peptidyl-prolyl cis-trans isomerase/HEAT repeat protein